MTGLFNYSYRQLFVDVWPLSAWSASPSLFSAGRFLQVSTRLSLVQHRLDRLDQGACRFHAEFHRDPGPRSLRLIHEVDV